MTEETKGVSFPWALAEEMVKQRFISRREHETDKTLLIWNYTKKAQYDKKWNAATLACRGLITRRGAEDGQFRIVARGFAKFFNWEELGLDKQRELIKRGERPVVTTKVT